MLLTIFPHTVIHSSISPHVGTKAMFLIVIVLTLISSAILPFVNTITMHFVQSPFAYVFYFFDAVRYFSFSLNSIVFELSLINICISKSHIALWSLFTILKLPLIKACPRISLFNSLSICFVIHKCSLINQPLLPRYRELAITNRNSVPESAFDYTFVCKSFFTFTVRYTIVKITLVFFTTWPQNFPFALRNFLIYHCVRGSL